MILRISVVFVNAHYQFHYHTNIIISKLIRIQQFKLRFSFMCFFSRYFQIYHRVIAFGKAYFDTVHRQVTFEKAHSFLQQVRWLEETALKIDKRLKTFYVFFLSSSILARQCNRLLFVCHNSLVSMVLLRLEF